MKKQERQPSILLSFTPFVILIALVVFVIRYFGADALGGASQLALLLSTGVVVVIAMTVCHVPWKKIENAIADNLHNVSPAIISAVQKVQGTKRKNAIYESVMNDSRTTVLNEFNVHRTVLYPGHMGTKKASWGATKQMAFELNEQGIDVAFLPEMPGKVSADSLIQTKKGVYHLADFKHATTTNSNTLSKDLAHGFEQAGTVVLKLEKMDVGQFRETIEYLNRNDIPFGNIILMNRYGNHLKLTYRDIKSGRYKSKIKGFL